MNILGEEIDESKIGSIDFAWKRDVGAVISIEFQDGSLFERMTMDLGEADALRKIAWPIAKSLSSQSRVFKRS
jgi:hypothetical protein